MKPITLHSVVLQISTIAFYIFFLDFIIGISVKHALILGCLQVAILISKALFLHELEKEKILEYELEEKKLEEFFRKMEDNKND